MKEALAHETEFNEYLPTTLARISTGIEAEINAITDDIDSPDYDDKPEIVDSKRETLAHLATAYAAMINGYIAVKQFRSGTKTPA